MYIINPDQYLLPSYRISPFRTIDIAINNKLPEDDTIDSLFYAAIFQQVLQLF